jgi:DNA-binding MarR family transcriptional regulator
MCQDDGFASGWEVMTAARRFQHRLEVFIDRSLEHLGMTFAQYRALEVLDANNDIHLSELARLFRVSRQAAGSTVAMLDRGALVDPVREAGRVYVTPSDVGRDRLVLCRRFTEDLKAQLEEHLTHGELHRLVLLLEKAGAALRSPALPEWWLAP